MLPTTLRKAAILISTLDERTAEALLDQMGPEHAAKVRSALVELEEIPREEEQRVVAEFMQQQDSPALAKALAAGDDDVELEISPALKNREAEPDSPQSLVNQPPIEPAGNCLPLQFLASSPPDALARALYAEQPQTIAAVIAYLSPEQSAGVMQHLPPELATEALERMATLDPLAPAVLADLERGLRKRLAGQIGASGPNSDSARRLSAVLDAMDFRQRERVLLQLSQRNRTLVGQLGLHPVAEDWDAASAYRATSFRYRLARPELTDEQGAGPQPVASRNPARTSVLKFADLALLDDASLRAVFAAAEPAAILLALTGADERLVSRVLRQLPARDAAVLRQRLEHPGPVRLREIDEAQKQLATIAGELAQQGAIRLPAAARFAAAA